MTTLTDLLEEVEKHFDGKNLDRVKTALQGDHAQELIDRLADSSYSTEQYVQNIAKSGTAQQQADRIITDLVTGTSPLDVRTHTMDESGKNAFKAYRKKALEFFNKEQAAIEKLIAKDAPAAVGGEFAKQFHDTAPTRKDLREFVRNYDKEVQSIERAVGEGRAVPSELAQARKKLKAAEGISERVGDLLKDSHGLERYVDRLAAKAEDAKKAIDGKKLWEIEKDLSKDASALNKARGKLGKAVEGIKDHLPSEVDVDSMIKGVERQGVSSEAAAKTTGRYEGQLKGDRATVGKHTAKANAGTAETVAKTAEKTAGKIFGMTKGTAAIVIGGAAALALLATMGRSSNERSA